MPTHFGWPRWIFALRLGGFPDGVVVAPVDDLGVASMGFRRSAFPCRRAFSRDVATGLFNGMRDGAAGKDSRPTAVLAPMDFRTGRCWPRWMILGWPRWIPVGRHSHADAHPRGMWPPVRSTASRWGGGKGFPPYDGVGIGGFPDGVVLAPMDDLGVVSVDFRRSAFPCRRASSRGMATGSFNGKRTGWREGIPALRRCWHRWVSGRGGVGPDG